MANKEQSRNWSRMEIERERALSVRQGIEKCRVRLDGAIAVQCLLIEAAFLVLIVEFLTIWDRLFLRERLVEM